MLSINTSLSFTLFNGLAEEENTELCEFVVAYLGSADAKPGYKSRSLEDGCF